MSAKTATSKARKQNGNGSKSVELKKGGSKADKPKGSGTKASKPKRQSAKAARSKSNSSKTTKPKGSSKRASLTQPVDKKLWPFYILKVLKRYAFEGAESDDKGNRYLTRQQIVDFLEADYGIRTQIKAIGDNLTRLYDASLEDTSLGFRLEFLEGERGIVRAADGKKEKQLLRRGWRYVETGNSDFDFQPSELRMLIDAVIASKVIPPRQARDLIENLCSLSAEKIVVPNTTREGCLPVENPEFFLNVELIHEAIREKKCISFTLGLFGTDGQLSVQRKGRKNRTHIVVPMQLLISKGRYYLLAHYPDNNEVYKYRVDLMKKVEIIEDSHVDSSESNINIVKYREQHAYMMSGKPVNVVLRINKESLHTLYDQFGPHVHFKNEQKDTIDVTLKSALYSVLFWALQYYRTVEVLFPPELREILADAGTTIHDMYSGEPGSMTLTDRQSNDELINGK